MHVRIAVTAGLALLAAGCDDTLFGVPEGGSGEPDPVYEVSYEGVQVMFEEHCADCHPGSNAFVLADLESDLEAGTGTYVVPGDPEASMFWRLIADRREDGDPLAMPLGSPGLPPAEREHVRLWIRDGAPLGGDDTDTTEDTDATR